MFSIVGLLQRILCRVPIVCELKKRDALPSGYLKSVLRLLSCQAVRQSFRPGSTIPRVRPPLRIAAGNKFGKVSLRIIIIVVVVSMTRQLPPVYVMVCEGGLC